MKTKLFLFVVFVFLSIIFSICTGSEGFSFEAFIHAIKNGGIDRAILLDLRLPRVAIGFCVGGILSVAGAILQAMFKNPLVEPYTLGISGGAALGVVFGMFFGISAFFWLPFCGFLGALVVMLLVYLFSIKKGYISLDKMLLIGVMISFISSSLVLFVEALVSPARLSGIVYWMMGSLQWVSKTGLGVISILSVFVFFASYLLSVHLNAMSLGEEDAKYLGVDVEKVKIAVFLIASLATGLSVSFVGIIGFVGLVVPHFFRITFSRDYRILLPLTFFGGGSFLIICDSLARSIVSPIELPVGVITGIIGGSTFIWVLSRRGLNG